MFSVGEFSLASGIPIRTLRFYHDERLLVPAAVDPATSYRSYDEHNLEVARVIVALRNLEFSLHDIREILDGCTDDSDILAHLERQKRTLAGHMKHYQSVVHQIDQVIHSQREAREADNMATSSYQIEERQLDPILVAGIRMKGSYGEIGKGLGMLCKRLGRHIAGKPLCLYYDGEYREEDANFEPCIPLRKNVDVEGVSVEKLPGGHAVTLIHRGPYGELSRSYARIFKYAQEHGYEVQLPTREVYLKGPGMIFRGNPKEYLTEIQLLVSKP